MNTPTDRYTTPAIALHWLLALLILGSLAVGLYMTGLALTPTRLKQGLRFEESRVRGLTRPAPLDD